MSTAKFLSVIDAGVAAELLSNIGKHYGITSEEALAEVLDSEESILDYVTGPLRETASALMQRQGMR